MADVAQKVYSGRDETAGDAIVLAPHLVGDLDNAQIYSKENLPTPVATLETKLTDRMDDY